MTLTVCRHGCLRRSCETCDLAEDVERLEKERDELAAALRELRYRSENFHLYLEGEHGVKLLSEEYDDHNVSEYFAAIQGADALLARIDSEAKP